MSHSSIPGRVAIVVVSYGSPDDVSGFLESVRRTASGVQIVVVDNPSDASEAIAAVVDPVEDAVLVRLDVNVGYGRAANAGVNILPPDVDAVVISNPDVRFHPGALDILVSGMLDGDGSVGPRILDEDGTIYPSAREIPSLRTGIGHALFSRVWPTNPWTRRYRAETYPADSARPAGWLSGACLLVRRSAFEEIGGFDEHYFMYFEDVDLGNRLGRAGWINRYLPAATVTHIGGTATAGSPAMLLVHHRSARRFLATKYRGWYLAPLRVALQIGLEARARWLTRGTGQRLASRRR